eukprot:XP_001709866.1 Hypothetical protein GL50803_34921 [Giardia lamblia ATCC 50803]
MATERVWCLRGDSRTSTCLKRGLLPRSLVGRQSHICTVLEDSPNRTREPRTSMQKILPPAAILLSGGGDPMRAISCVEGMGAAVRISQAATWLSHDPLITILRLLGRTHTSRTGAACLPTSEVARFPTEVVRTLPSAPPETIVASLTQSTENIGLLCRGRLAMKVRSGSFSAVL